MPPIPKTYEDWLALLPEQREEIHFKSWNVYKRDGFAIAFMAAVRLAFQTSFRVLEIQVGTYHGGEYILRLSVSQEDYLNCPQWLQQTFEGFRVAWTPHPFLEVDPAIDVSLDGKWSAESGDCEFELRRTASGVDISGICRATGEQLNISNIAIDRAFVHFTSFHPTLAKTINHVFRLCSVDRCEDFVSTTDYYRRIAAAKNG
jgi:hypothetical protein